MRFLALAAAATLAASSSSALAAYPDHAITFIIPYGPGGTSDTGARTWAPHMEKCLGTTIVMQNKPGAGGELGFAELARAKPDGYTLGALNVPNAPLGSLTKPSPAYTMDSFTYLANFYGSKVSINTRKDGPYASLAELVNASKKSQINMGISNFGSDDHVMMLRFMKMAAAKFTFIPMSDAATSRNAVIGGHVDVSGNSMTEVAPYQDVLHTLAIASDERVPALPGVPTFKEQGYDLVGGSNHVIGGPAGLPADIVAKLDGCFAQVAKDPDFLKEADKRTLLMNPMDAAATAAWVRQETGTLKALWESDPWIK